MATSVPSHSQALPPCSKSEHRCLESPVAMRTGLSCIPLATCRNGQSKTNLSPLSLPLCPSHQSLHPHLPSLSSSPSPTPLFIPISNPLRIPFDSHSLFSRPLSSLYISLSSSPLLHFSTCLSIDISLSLSLYISALLLSSSCLLRLWSSSVVLFGPRLLCGIFRAVTLENVYQRLARFWSILVCFGQL